MELVHKLWTDSGILIHSIHKHGSDKGLSRPQPVDEQIFTPIIFDLTSRFLLTFNSIHNFTMSCPQVMHRLWVNYSHVIPQAFGVSSGMSPTPAVRTETF